MTTETKEPIIEIKAATSYVADQNESTTGSSGSGDNDLPVVKTHSGDHDFPSYGDVQEFGELHGLEQHQIEDFIGLLERNDWNLPDGAPITTWTEVMLRNAGVVEEQFT